MVRSPNANAVYITDMPDFKDAISKIADVAATAPEALQSALKELGLYSQYESLGESAGALAKQQQELTQTKDALSTQLGEFKKRRSSYLWKWLGFGSLASAGGGIAGAMIHDKTAPLRSPWFTAVVSAIATAVLWTSGVLLLRERFPQHKTEQDIAQIEQQATQLARDQQTMQVAFIEEMAIEMLRQQKAFTGEGQQAHLVSTAEPAEKVSAVEAAPPTTSKAEAVIKQKEARAGSQARAA